MLKENLGLRIFAIFLAIIIWFQSVLVSEHRTVLSFPLNLQSVPPGITIEELPQKIGFNVRGRGMDIIRLKMARPNVYIDASGISSTTKSISLQDYVIDLPENVNVTLLGPSETEQLQVQTDTFHQKKVPVKLDFANLYTRNSFEDLRYILNPENVTIFGPKSRLKNISMILTEEIDREVLSSNGARLSLIVPDPEISVSEAEVQLSISGTQESTKVFADISLPRAYIPSRVAVRVQAPALVLDRLNPDDLKVTLSENPDEKGLYAVEIQSPDNVKVIAVTPDRVRAREGQ